MNKGMLKIIDKLVDNAIKEKGMENKKTIVIVENAERLKEKIENNTIKVY